jgi:hypothetical protein
MIYHTLKDLNVKPFFVYQSGPRIPDDRGLHIFLDTTLEIDKNINTNEHVVVILS